MTLHQLMDYLAPSESRRLLGFIVASLIFHAAMFSLLIVEMPSGSLATKRPQKVTLWTPELSKGKYFFPEEALRLFDPKKIIYSPEPLLEPQGIRSLVPDIGRFEPVGIDHTEYFKMIVEPVARQRDFAGMIQKKSAAALRDFRSPLPKVEIETPPASQGSRIRLSGELEGYRLAGNINLPEPNTSIALRSVLLGLRVDRRGFVTAAFIDETCGERELDALALAVGRKLRFEVPPSATQDVWGAARIYWNLKEGVNGA